MMRSTILLLVIPKVENNKGIVTGKFFEYMAAGKPVLAIGPTDGDLAKLIAETQCGEIFEYEECLKIKSFIISNLNKTMKEKSNKLFFSRYNLTKLLVKLI
jgi:hypothetical protein